MKVASKAPLGAIQRRRLMERLELLCSSGVGFEAIAPSICDIVRDLLEAVSGSVFWFDEAGQPGGFFHDCAPVELKDFFVANFDALFSHPDELNMVGLLQTGREPIGYLTRPEVRAAFPHSNVYRYLAKPLGHEYMFEIRVDHEGRGRLLFCGWNPEGRLFAARHHRWAQPILELLRMAVAGQSGETVWRSLDPRAAHLVIDGAGQTLLAIDEDAERMLQRAHLLRQNIPMDGELVAAPSFAGELMRQLAVGSQAEMAVPCAGGRLLLRAARTRLRTGGEATDAVSISVEAQQAVAVQAIERLCLLPLTMLQKRIACHAMQGGGRADCEALFGVSQQALKKHLGAVYEALGATTWQDLQSRFGQGGASPD